MKFKLIVFIISILSFDLTAQTEKWCLCNDTLTKDLVMTWDWRKLPNEYRLVKEDSYQNGELCEYKIIKGNQVVAVGQTVKDNYPHGSWYIIHEKGASCCWGDFNKGYKFRRWYCYDNFEIVYKNKKAIIQDKKKK